MSESLYRLRVKQRVLVSRSKAYNIVATFDWAEEADARAAKALLEKAAAKSNAGPDISVEFVVYTPERKFE